MKGRLVILTSLALMCGGNGAWCSECTGAGCDIAPTAGEPTVLGVIEETKTVTVTPVAPAQLNTVPAVPTYSAQPQYIYAGAVPMRNIKTISIKPVPEDTRPALYDGTHGNYKTRGYDKTVDWRDGVPIWDDSIVSYKTKDFSDWYLEPAPEIYLREIDSPAESVFAQYGMPPAVATTTESVDVLELYNQNMADAATTRARVEELLAPQKPAESLWTDTLVVNNMNMPAPKPEYVAQDMTNVIAIAFGGDGCPFDSETECEIWRRKPMVRETVAPRSTKLRPELLDAFIAKAKCNKNITAKDPTAAPLLDRYKMLMRSAQACCTDGMAYSLKKAGASDGLVYKFLADDANFYGLGNRCLMMTDAEFDAKYPNTATAAVAADVRNGCLCRGRQWFTAMLAPFRDAYAAAPEFAQSKFDYTYIDGLQREITVSINNDVQNVLNQLAQCP
ncbi:MAG: hypothetical protein K2I81_04135 [Alphaproteobacteria bacterium]|nr:hypothetical protein [Alphaproteobacteria bacterium]